MPCQNMWYGLQSPAEFNSLLACHVRCEISGSAHVLRHPSFESPHQIRGTPQQILAGWRAGGRREAYYSSSDGGCRYPCDLRYLNRQGQHSDSASASQSLASCLHLVWEAPRTSERAPELRTARGQLLTERLLVKLEQRGAPSRSQGTSITSVLTLGPGFRLYPSAKTHAALVACMLGT